MRNCCFHVPFWMIVIFFGWMPLQAAERDDDCWNLADIYPNEEAWIQAKDAAEVQIGKIKDYKGRLGESPQVLLECLDATASIQKEVRRIFSYASMLSDEDTRGDRPAQMREEAQLLATELSRQVSFINPEILALGTESIQTFQRQEPGLKVYAQLLRNILRQAPHTRSREVEQVIAEVGRIATAPANVRRTLTNADIPWPTILLADGTEARLDAAGYTKYRAVPNRADRKRVFDAFWKTWKVYERTLGTALYAQLNRDHFYGQVRNYPTSLAAALGNDNIPEAVYHTLIRETNANLGTLHRYFKLRARMLGVDDPGYHDLYPPLVETDLEFPLERAQKMALECSRPLGDDYVAVMKKGFAGRWIDYYPRPGKRSGAYMNGSVYDVHPYMLLNYNADFESVSTLVHEFGHALHSYLSNTHQPYINSDYSTFVAEVASTSNEALLMDYVTKHAQNDAERLYYLGFALEGIRGTFFRQAMFAEFELKIHEMVDRGEVLTGPRFTEIYGELLHRYHGHDEGVLQIDPLYAIEWAYIPHFYYNFYVFQYATSIAGGSLLSADVLAGKPAAQDRYLDLLKAGSSEYAYDLLKRAGVDLATPEPYRALAKRANQIMDDIEAILERQDSARK